MYITKNELRKINKAYKIYDKDSYVVISNDRLIVRDKSPFGNEFDYTNKYQLIDELKEAIRDDKKLPKELKIKALSYLQ